MEPQLTVGQYIDRETTVETTVAAADATLEHARSTLVSEEARLDALLSDDRFAGTSHQVLRLDAAAEITMGRQRSPKHQSGEHQVPYLRAANVKDGYLSTGDVYSMNFSPEEQQKYRLHPGDVLVTEGCGSRAQVGASARWNDDLDGVVCFQNTLLRLRARTGIADASFIYHWARWAFETGLWADVASGTNIFHIGATRAAKLSISLPPLAVQRRVAEVLDACESVAHSARRVNQAALGLRRSAMTEAVDAAGVDETEPILAATHAA